MKKIEIMYMYNVDFSPLSRDDRDMKMMMSILIEMKDVKRTHKLFKLRCYEYESWSMEAVSV